MTPADLADTRCPDCGHPRTCDACSCTGPGTCGGGTDDVEPFREPFSIGALYLMSLMHDYKTGRPLGTMVWEAHRDV